MPVGVLNALIRLTFQTAAPATVCAFIGFVFSLTFPNVVPHARVVGTLASNVILPKLYAFSMMWTLNARVHIRAELNASGGGNISTFNTAQNVQRTVVHDPELGTAEGKLASAEFCEPRKPKLLVGRAAVVKRAEVVEDRRIPVTRVLLITLTTQSPASTFDACEKNPEVAMVIMQGFYPESV
ncbi:hypothetical protein DFH06DRAFT_1344260 [Mycena polygramma]|nr:hypothetical protein DFH06DRAFT_1346201 [Mycena polygramma]KAJ7614310.1 hypothetical protein DFH06DRAFT_1344260 [Mycena polygramma]